MLKDTPVIRFIVAQAGGDSSDPFESISSFFDSGLWSAISIMLQIFVVLLWLALIYWTWQDARRRIVAGGPIAACVALSVLIPFLGTVIYLIVRPPEYLDEARERELELLALEQRLGELGDAEGQEIVGRILAREGMTADPHNLARSLRQSGVASYEDVRDLDQRLTELEFRLRVLDRASVPRDVNDPPDRRSLPRETPRETTGDTGRSWRRTRSDPDTGDA